MIDYYGGLHYGIVMSNKGKGKTGLLVNLTRIQIRAEADGLRAAWAEALDRLKAVCEP